MPSLFGEYRPTVRPEVSKGEHPCRRCSCFDTSARTIGRYPQIPNDRTPGCTIGRSQTGYGLTPRCTSRNHRWPFAPGQESSVVASTEASTEVDILGRNRNTDVEVSTSSGSSPIRIPATGCRPNCKNLSYTIDGAIFDAPRFDGGHERTGGSPVTRGSRSRLTPMGNGEPPASHAGGNPVPVLVGTIKPCPPYDYAGAGVLWDGHIFLCPPEPVTYFRRDVPARSVCSGLWET